jgi:hypothetical protein
VVSSLLSPSLLFLLPFDRERRGTSAGTDGRDHNMRESFVVPVNSQRREMAGNVILYVCLILPPTLPLPLLSFSPPFSLTAGSHNCPHPPLPETPPF